MRFEEAYEGYRKRRLTKSGGQRCFGHAIATFRHYISRYDEPCSVDHTQRHAPEFLFLS